MRVLITRPKAQATAFANELRQIGAEPIFFPTIEIKPVDDPTGLDRALSQLESYDWLVLTSANAASVVIKRIAELGIDGLPASLRVAAIGPATAAWLKKCGISLNFVPEQHIAEAIMPGLGNLRGRWVLLPMADIAGDTLPNAIQNAGGIAHVITAYHTISAQANPEALTALQAGVDIVTFTSGSTVRNFQTLLENAGLDPLNLPGNPLIACIGPKTEQAACQLGFNVAIVASPHTTVGLVNAIQKHSELIPSR
jgi:uroporphyrinogen-III synthase